MNPILQTLDTELEEFETFLTEQLSETETMRSLLWARLPESRLSPEEKLVVAQMDSA